MGFDGPDDLRRFVAKVRAELERAGLDGAAGRLAAIQDSPFTTGAEWLGELGLAVKEIRKERALPAGLDAKLKRIQKEVRRVWPAL